jgi:hypothetical protein
MERASRDDHVLLKCWDTKIDGTGRTAAKQNPRDCDAMRSHLF